MPETRVRNAGGSARAMPRRPRATSETLAPRTGIAEPDDPPGALATAFETFAKASRSLEAAHETLRSRVESLSLRLSETEGRLHASLEENTRLAALAARRGRLEAMGRMAAEIAHEVRNPLGSLELTASLLRDDLAGDPGRHDLAVSILDGIRALTRVSGNLLTFTRSVSPRIESLDAGACLARTRDLVAPVCAARGATVVIEAPDGLRVEADSELLQQILLNLVQNALEATTGPTCVRLVAQAGSPGGVEFLVIDTGRGIDAETLARVFDPFFTTKESGTGLGLSVSHRLAEAQGARLELQSTPGSGTTARLLFGDSELVARRGNALASALGSAAQRFAQGAEDSFEGKLGHSDPSTNVDRPAGPPLREPDAEPQLDSMPPREPDAETPIGEMRLREIGEKPQGRSPRLSERAEGAL